MTTGKKPIPLALLLLIVISVPSILFLTWQIQTLLVKHEMMEKLEESNLRTLKISAKEVNWYEEDKEIIVDGKLFDVKSFVQQDDGYVVFLGLFDEEETDIKKQVEELLQKQGDETGKKMTARFFFIPIYKDLIAGQLDPPCFHTTHHTNNRTDKIPAVFLSVLIPPPKI